MPAKRMAPAINETRTILRDRSLACRLVDEAHDHRIDQNLHHDYR